MMKLAEYLDWWCTLQHQQQQQQLEQQQQQLEQQQQQLEQQQPPPGPGPPLWYCKDFHAAREFPQAAARAYTCPAAFRDDWLNEWCDDDCGADWLSEWCDDCDDDDANYAAAAAAACQPGDGDGDGRKQQQQQQQQVQCAPTAAATTPTATAAASDYRFVYLGPRGTRTPLHADVLRSFSWSVNLAGRKRWRLLPPQVGGRASPPSLGGDAPHLLHSPTCS